MRNIGDKVFYPMHGAGIIKDIDDIEIGGETKKSYSIYLPVTGMKIMIPVDSTTTTLTDIISQDDTEKIIDCLKNEEVSLDKSWNKRYRDNMEIIKNGDILGITKIYKALSIAEHLKGLSMSERNMLSLARQILFSQLMLYYDMTFDEISSKVKEYIKFDE